MREEKGGEGKKKERGRGRRHRRYVEDTAHAAYICRCGYYMYVRAHIYTVYV